MTPLSSEKIRLYIIGCFRDQLDAKGINPSHLPDDFDLLTEGVIDSFGLLELVVGMEEEFGLDIDFEELDPEELTMIGPLSRFISEQSGAA